MQFLCVFCLFVLFSRVSLNSNKCCSTTSLPQSISLSILPFILLSLPLSLSSLPCSMSVTAGPPVMALSSVTWLRVWPPHYRIHFLQTRISFQFQCARLFSCACKCVWWFLCALMNHNVCVFVDDCAAQKNAYPFCVHVYVCT